MLKNFLLAIKQLWRECRFGDWYVIFFAVLFAVGATTALHFYTDRLSRAFEMQSQQFLGGNVAIESNTPIPPAFIAEAKAAQLKYAEVLSYPSTLNSSKGFQLITVQAVSKAYPLLEPAQGRPTKATLWADPRLLEALHLKLNDTIKIGAATFKISKQLSNETDSLSTGWLIAPRVIIQLEDVAATKTVVPGSRVQYRLLLLGEKKQLARFQAIVTPELQGGQRWIDPKDQASSLQNILVQFENYLQIIILVTLVISGVAIFLSLREYMQKHFGHIALWRTLGASRAQIIQIFLWQFLLIALFAGCAGILLGYFTQNAIANLFKSVFMFTLPGVSIKPLFLGFLTALFLLFAFVYPVIRILAQTPPLYIWRGEAALPIMHYGIFFTSVLVVLILFLYLFLDFSLLTLFFIDLLLISMAFLLGLSILLLKLVKQLRQYTRGVYYRGFSGIIERPQSFSFQFVGFTLILLLLICLYFLRGNLLNEWRLSLPANTPNYFLINLSQEDLPHLKENLRTAHIPIEQIYPLVRGRLISLNGKPILAAIPPDARRHNALHRELNLTWTLEYPKDNKVISGAVWSKSIIGKPYVSVENSLAKKLHLKLGDVLGFQIGSETFQAAVANFRSVDWTSFHPNFFMIFTPGLLEKFPTTYITSIHLDAQQLFLLTRFQKQFPNITVIDVANLLMQIQTIIGKISLALQYLFLFALIACGLIFITTIQASLDERKQTYHLIRILGASKYFIIMSLLVELVTLASLILGCAFFFAYLLKFLLLSFLSAQ